MFERKHAAQTWRTPATPTGPRYDAVVFGLGRYGQAIVDELRASGLGVLGIDFDPDAVKRARETGHDALFGDASDPEFVGHLNWNGVAWAISAVPEHGLGVTHEDPRLSLLTTLYRAEVHRARGGRRAQRRGRPDRSPRPAPTWCCVPTTTPRPTRPALVLGRAQPGAAARDDGASGSGQPDAEPPHPGQKELAL
ncbi:MAG: NAD-binding protein [Rhodovibrio sp.]|nr:NAD-binding protein [Rhodovibrio sp.]